MKKILTGISIIFIGFCALLIVLCIAVLIIFLFYDDGGTYSSSDFSESTIAITEDFSQKAEVITYMKNYIHETYDLPLYLQRIEITILKDKENTSYMIMFCDFNTYRKESKEYGQITANVDLSDMKFFNIDATFGYDKEFAALKKNKELCNMLKDFDHILKVSLDQIKQNRKGTEEYRYTLYLRGKETSLYNDLDESNYIYEDKNGRFIKEKK